MADMTRFEVDVLYCSASGPDTCPSWFYCNVASNRCKPCKICNSKWAGLTAPNKCVEPLGCREGTPLKCKELYSKTTNEGKATSHSEGYVGSRLKTTCLVNNHIHKATLDCQLNTTSQRVEWLGDFTCVTQEPPPVVEEPTRTSSLPTKVVIPSVLFLLLVVGIIVTCLMVKKYRKRAKGRSDCMNVNKVSCVPAVSTKARPSPCQHNNLQWNDSQEQQDKPERKYPTRPSLQTLSLHYLSQFNHSIQSFNSSEETRPKTVEAETDHLLSDTDGNLVDGHVDTRVSYYSEVGSYPNGLSSSLRDTYSLQGQYEERQCLVLPSNHDWVYHSSLHLDSLSVCSADFNQTQIKEVGIKKPTEHVWTDSMQCASQSSLHQISLHVGFSASSDTVLHNRDLIQTITVTNGLANTPTEASISDDTQGPEVELQSVGDQSTCRQTCGRLTSDSLLMSTSSSFTPSEQTHIHMQNVSHQNEAEDSGVSIGQKQNE